MTIRVFTLAAFVLASSVPLGAAGGVDKLDVSLNIQEWAGVNRRADIVSTGVPMPYGLMTDADLAKIAVFAPDGRPVPAQFKILERWRELTRSSPAAREWEETDLAQDSTVARIWREEGISCLKRSTLGRYVLGTLDDDWNMYIDFHVDKAGCPRCNANLEDLHAEDERDEATRQQFRERCFASSVGFLSKTPQ